MARQLVQERHVSAAVDPEQYELTYTLMGVSVVTSGEVKPRLACPWRTNFVGSTADGAMTSEKESVRRPLFMFRPKLRKMGALVSAVKASAMKAEEAEIAVTELEVRSVIKDEAKARYDEA